MSDGLGDLQAQLTDWGAALIHLRCRDADPSPDHTKEAHRELAESMLKTRWPLISAALDQAEQRGRDNERTRVMQAMDRWADD